MVDPRAQTTMLGQAGGLGYCGPVAMETRPRYPGIPGHQSFNCKLHNGRLLMTHTEASTPPGERGTCAAPHPRPTAAVFTARVGQPLGSLGRAAGGSSPCGAYGHAWCWVRLPASEPKQRLNRPSSCAGLRGVHGSLASAGLSEGGSGQDAPEAPEKLGLFPVSVGRGLPSLEACSGGAYNGCKEKLHVHGALQCASSTPYNPQQ